MYCFPSQAQYVIEEFSRENCILYCACQITQTLKFSVRAAFTFHKVSAIAVSAQYATKLTSMHFLHKMVRSLCFPDNFVQQA